MCSLKRVNVLLKFHLFFFLFFANKLISQTVLLNPSGDGGFETGTDFTSNGWSTAMVNNNLWYVGTADVNSGARSAYISTNGSAGAANTYNKNSSRVNHIYRDITFPSGITNIVLTFNWKCVGELNSLLSDKKSPPK